MNILNKLTIKHLKMNPKRTIVTIIGIILSTALMVGIGTIASSFRDNALKQVIESNGDYHVKMREVPYQNMKYIENHVDVKSVTMEHALGYAYLENSLNLYKPYLFVEEVSDSYFSGMELIEGRFPKNDQELVISEHIGTNGDVHYQVGDQITLAIGTRVLPEENEDSIAYELTQRYGLEEGETLSISTEKTYTIVGIMPRLNQEPYQAPGYTVLTKLNEKALLSDAKIDATILYKKIKNIHSKTEKLAETVDLPYYENKDGVKYYDHYIDYNESLLSFYGESSYTSINDMLSGIIIVILGLIMIGCAIVIYNSFAISVMERKKQFGLFSSIGATKRQLKKTVFYEAFLVSIIGIPLGILSGIFGIWVVLEITNTLLKGAFHIPLQLSLYPSFIIIPIIYMVITILISAYLPARKASKITPIEAIRLNDDIKVKRKSVKTNRLTKKLFGMEGELALKNMKRNKKKYRITILSLIVSIVLFVSFSTFVGYAKQGTSSILEVPNYDLILQYNASRDDLVTESVNQMLALDGISDQTTIQTVYMTFDKLNGGTKDFLAYQQKEATGSTEVIVLNDQEYKAYLKKLHLKEQDYLGEELKPILVNHFSHYDYVNMKIKNMKVFDNFKSPKITFLQNYTAEPVEQFSEMERRTVDLTVVDQMPNTLLDSHFKYQLKLIISEEMLQDLENHYEGYVLGDRKLSLVKAEEHRKVYDEMEQIKKNMIGEDNYYVYIADVTEAMQLQKNIVIVVGMFLYGFIALVTLIGVTSVFNTIHTSIALRRKEFAVLRSVGLTPKGFNKMICYESILYGLKALLIGLPISLLVILLFHTVFMNVVRFDSILIPWNAVIIATIGVFLITFITMIYASKKIKKENILDAIREENI